MSEPTAPATPVAPATPDPTITGAPATPAPATTGTSVSVTPEASVGFNLWGTKAGGQSAYVGPTGSLGVKVVWEDPSRKVNPYFRARVVGGWSGNEVKDQTAAQDAERTEVSDENSSGAEAGEDPFGNDISAESGGENINNIGATKNTFNRLGGEVEGGIEHRLSDGPKGTTVGSVGIYGEFGGASGVARVNSYYDGSQNLGGYLGGGLRLGISRIFKPKKAGAPEGFIGGELSGGVRAVTYSVPGNDGGGDPAVGGVFGGALVGGLRFGRKGRTPTSGTPEAVQPGTLIQADLTTLQNLVGLENIKDGTGAIINSPGARYFEIDFRDGHDIKDAKGRTIDKITFTWVPEKSAWVSQVHIKDDDPMTADIVTDSGFTAEHRSVADIVSSLTSLIFKLVPIGSSETTKMVAGLGTYERPDSSTVFKDQDAHLGFVTSPTEIKATVRVNGVDLPDKITIPANTRTPIVIPAAKLGSANLVIDRPFPVSIRNEMQGGVELAFDYKVQPVAPPAPAFAITGISGNTSSSGRGTAKITFTGTLPAGIKVGKSPTDTLPASMVRVVGQTIEADYRTANGTQNVYDGANNVLYTFTLTKTRSSGSGSRVPPLPPAPSTVVVVD